MQVQLILHAKMQAVTTNDHALTRVLCFEEPVAGVAIEDGLLSRGKVLGVPKDFVSKSSSSS